MCDIHKERKAKIDKKFEKIQIQFVGVKIFEGQRFTIHGRIYLSVIGATLNSLNKRVLRWFTVKIPKLVFRRHWCRPESSIRNESISQCLLSVPSVGIHVSVSWGSWWFEVIWQRVWNNLTGVRKSQAIKDGRARGRWEWEGCTAETSQLDNRPLAQRKKYLKYQRKYLRKYL